MSEKFKKGDVIRAAQTFVVSEVKDTGLLRVEENSHGLLYAEPDLVELVEPTVTHSELREVLTELKQRDPGNTAWSAALDAFFFQLTGEPA